MIRSLMKQEVKANYKLYVIFLSIILFSFFLSMDIIFTKLVIF